VREIGKMIEKINREREKADDSFDAFKKVYMHIDAVQGAYYLTLNAPHLHVDLLSISAHKLYGPKGVGALYVRTGTPLRCITSGGEQEYSLRPGTYNTPGIVGFGAAMELINNEAAHARDIDHIRSLRENFLKDLKEKIPSSIINGSADYCVPGTISMRIPGISGESLVLALDMKGIAVSTGSACSAGSISPSRTLCEMGLSMQAVRESVRISLGKYSTQEELSYVIDALAEYASKK
jgi:cysteine desulfurase